MNDPNLGRRSRHPAADVRTIAWARSGGTTAEARTRALAVRVDAAAEDRLDRSANFALRALLREGPDHVDADDVLLGDGGDVRHPLLDVARTG
jgi:hypothetical protein